MPRDDRELTEQLWDELRFDNRFDATRLDVRVLDRDGSLVVSGLVSDPWQKFFIQRLLERMLGLDEIANELRVAPGPARTDEEIADELVRSFIEEPYLDERTIRAEVHDGVVHLRGEVPSLLRKRLAGVVAWWRAGVQDVVNELQVIRPEPDGNEELAEAIKVVLEKDPLVDGSAVALHVTDRGAVRLTGAVVNTVEREAAENDVWCVLGVRSVENQLEVVPPATPGESYGPAT